MMKLNDVRTATALIIQGYLGSCKDEPSDATLQNCLNAIMQECENWAENLVDDGAVEPEAVSIDLNVPRTPYNLRSAMQALGTELAELDGTESIIQFGKINPETSEIS